MEKLGIQPNLLITQIVNFVLLIVLLRLFLYQPVRKMLNERAARIKKGMEDAEKAAQQAALAQEEFERRIAEAKQKGQEIIAQATQTGEKARKEILAKAEEEARQLREKARQELERDRRQAMIELRQQVADLSIQITEKLLKETLDEDTQHRLIGQFLTEAGELK